MTVGRENMAVLRRKERAEFVLKQHTLLLEEFKLGIYTVETYRKEVTKLENSESPTGSRAQSPTWDTENGADLPEDSDDIYA